MENSQVDLTRVRSSRLDRAFSAIGLEHGEIDEKMGDSKTTCHYTPEIPSDGPV